MNKPKIDFLDPNTTNDTPYTPEQIEKRLKDGVDIFWGKSSVRVEQHMITSGRKIWEEMKKELSEQGRIEYQEGVYRSIEEGFKKLKAKNPEREDMNNLVADLVIWYIMSGN